jgi:hypothetical protein
MRTVWRRDRDGRWLLLALAVHALLLGSARVAFREQPASLPAPKETPQELAVDYDLETWRNKSEVPGAAPATTESPVVAAPRARQSAAPEPLDNGPPEAEVAVVEAAPDVVDAAPPAAGANAGGNEVDLGIGADAWQRWAALGRETAPGAPAGERRAGAYETPGAPKPSRTGGVQEGLEAHDRKLGLGPRGRVISAFHRAAHAGVGPELGTASFLVTVLKTGEVQISVGASSGETDKWRAVAARAADDLKKSLPRIPSSREGVRLVIDLVAEETYPNGTNPEDLYGPRLEAQAPQIKSTDETKKQLEADNPLAGKDPNNPIPQFPLKIELPGVYLSQRGKVCGYRLGVTPLGLALNGGCDPSNVGVKPQRIVRAKVREEAMF